MTTHLLGALYAIIAAFLYGGADFSGGFATRRLNHFQVLWLSSLMGAVVLVALTLFWGEGLPTVKSIVYASLASVFGGLGLATLYNALAVGRASVVAPASAVVAAALPVFFAAIVEGLPDPVTLTGFILAALGIWLTTRANGVEGELLNDGLLPGVLAGLAFGGFFILIAQVEPGPIFSPLIFGKMSAAALGLIFLLVKKLPLPPVKGNPYALLAGFLDVLANVLYLVASNLTRVDIAAVLVCTYPAVTVMLAMIILKEQVTRTQMIGVFACLVAIALIII